MDCSRYAISIQQTSLTSSNSIGGSGSGALNGSSPRCFIVCAIASDASTPAADSCASLTTLMSFAGPYPHICETWRLNLQDLQRH